MMFVVQECCPSIRTNDMFVAEAKRHTQVKYDIVYFEGRTVWFSHSC